VNESGIVKEVYVSVESHARVSTDTCVTINNESVDEISAMQMTS